MTPKPHAEELDPGLRPCPNPLCSVHYVELVIERASDQDFRAVCNNCGLKIGWVNTREAAVNNWNALVRRQDSEALESELERLRAQSLRRLELCAKLTDENERLRGEKRELQECYDFACKDREYLVNRLEKKHSRAALWKRAAKNQKKRKDMWLRQAAINATTAQEALDERSRYEAVLKEVQQHIDDMWGDGHRPNSAHIENTIREALKGGGE